MYEDAQQGEMGYNASALAYAQLFATSGIMYFVERLGSERSGRNRRRQTACCRARAREKGPSLEVDGVSACVPRQSSARLVVLRGQWRDFATHLDALGLLVDHGSDGRGDVGSPLDLLNVLRLLGVGTRRCVRTNPTRSARCRKAHGGGGRRGHLGGDLRCGGLAGSEGWLRGGKGSGGLALGSVKAERL
jgi:hypothetical protein